MPKTNVVVGAEFAEKSRAKCGNGTGAQVQGPDEGSAPCPSHAPASTTTQSHQLIDPAPNLMPAIFRLETIEHHQDSGRTRNCATLFHEAATVRVAWSSREVDSRLVGGCLVGIHWLGNPVSIDGQVRISRLVPAMRPDAQTDLFRTVPFSWVRDRELLKRASGLWSELPASFRQILNAVLWDGQRFHRYVAGPSSLGNHHNSINGNLRHSVEVAELARSLGGNRKLASLAILVLGGLIHDAGKADEYRFDRVRRCFEMSEEGVLIGHRDRLQHWLASAIARYNINIPQPQLLGLIHALTAARAPAYLGLREPRSLEATILSTADRLSGEGEMYSRLATPEGGFGRYHRHLRGRPFVSGPAELESCV